MTEPHHLEERFAWQRLDRVIPTRDGLQEFELPRQSIPNIGGGLGVGLELRHTLAQHHDGRINLAPLAPLDDDADDLPGIVLSGEEIAPVAEGVRDLNEVPGN